HRLSRDQELALAEVAEPAVDQLRGPARGSGREVLGFDEQRLLSVACGLAEDAGAGDSTADDDEIPGLIEAAPDLVAKSAQPHAPRACARIVQGSGYTTLPCRDEHVRSIFAAVSFVDSNV